jgi:hypothetical protein
MLCRIDTLNTPSSWASEWWLANVMVS